MLKFARLKWKVIQLKWIKFYFYIISTARRETMEPAEDCWSSLFIPGQSTVWKYYPKTDSSRTINISKLVKADALWHDLIPLGISDGWIVNDKFKTLLSNFEINEIDNFEILGVLRSKYFKTMGENKINKTSTSNNLFVSNEDIWIKNISSEIKEEVCLLSN